MTKRKGLSKKLRFEVFKRDKFTCQYCGKRAPDVVLNADHVEPVVAGGTNDIMNLVTSCFDCNAGKADRKLDDGAALQKAHDQLAALELRREQLDMMLQWQKSLANLDNETCDKLHELWSELVPGWHLTDKGLLDLAKLIRSHGAALVAESMRKATGQYLLYEGDPPKPIKDSVNKAWDYVFRITKFAKTNSDKPYMRDLFYVRAIVRNKFTYCKDWHALKLIRDAYEAGVPIEMLKDMAKGAYSWASWQDEIIAETDRQCAKQGSL